MPSRVPKEERRGAVEARLPKLPPKRQRLPQPGDLVVIVKIRKRLPRPTHRHRRPLHQTPTRPPATPPSQAGFLKHQPKGRASR